MSRLPRLMTIFAKLREFLQLQVLEWRGRSEGRFRVGANFRFWPVSACRLGVFWSVETERHVDAS